MTARLRSLFPRHESGVGSPADEVGAFALKSWEAWLDGSLPVRKLIKSAVGFTGKLQSLALEEGIVPPEAAMSELAEEAQAAARHLLETGLQFDADLKLKYRMQPATASRIVRVLKYVEVIENPSAETGTSPS